MSFNTNPFNRFNHFNPESRLSEFRKRFEDFSQNPNQMLIDNKVGNRWPNGLDRHSMGKTMRSDDNEDKGIPIKVFHEKTNERQSNDSNDEKNSDSMSSVSSQSQRSNETSNSSGSVGSVFNSNRNQTTPESASASGQPRVHHIPITIEPREGSTSSGYTSESNTTVEQPLSRSSSHSSAQSVGSSGKTLLENRSPSPAKSVSSEHSCASNDSKARVTQIPIKVDTKSTTSSSPLNKSKPKTKAFGKTTETQSKPKSGPFVTRIPVGPTQSQSKPNESTADLGEELAPKSDQKANPLEVINKILIDLKRYESEVNKYKGTADDKYYRYLDEMLTRFMIKLDTIETNGCEDVRKARKAAVIAVNNSIALLESKVTKKESNIDTSAQPITESKVEAMDVSVPKSIEEKPNKEIVESMETQEKTDNKEENGDKCEDKEKAINCSENQSLVQNNRKETAV